MVGETPDEIVGHHTQTCLPDATGPQLIPVVLMGRVILWDMYLGKKWVGSNRDLAAAKKTLGRIVRKGT